MLACLQDGGQIGIDNAWRARQGISDVDVTDVDHGELTPQRRLALGGGLAQDKTCFRQGDRIGV